MAFGNRIANLESSNEDCKRRPSRTTYNYLRGELSNENIIRPVAFRREKNDS